MGKTTTKSIADQRLLDGLLANDARRIQTLYDRILPGVRLDVRQMGGTDEQAHDAFQEALIALFRRLRAPEDFTLTCTLKSYLRVVCRNLWLARQRRDQRTVELPETTERVDLDPGMQERLERSERDRLFWRHFDALGEDCREILRAFFAKVPFRQLAQQRGTSEGYLKKRKHVCKKKLTERIQTDPEFKHH